MTIRAVAVACLVCAVATSCSACIYQYGSRREAQAQAGKQYSYGYNGLDWANDFETCRGKRQSPILLLSSGAAAKGLPAPVGRSTFMYGSLTNPVIINNGHTLQVSLPNTFESDVQIPVRGDKNNATGLSVITGSGPPTGTVKAVPAQLHFHAHSEHIMNGAQLPLEMHIVHFIRKDQLPACGEAGCPAVLGVLLELTDNESEVKPELRKIIEAMPLNEEESATINGSININNLLPANRTYITYEGSLTTPPCTEGILWHVLTNPIKISQTLLTLYQEAVGDTMCDGNATEAHKQNTTTVFKLPPNDKEGCHKLANGHNWRAVQPINQRPICLAAF